MSNSNFPEKQLAIGADENELIFIVANMMSLGYVPDGDDYKTNDGYHCQPMALPGRGDSAEENSH